MVGGLLFGIFAIFLFLGVPIAICLGLASTVTLMVLGDVPLAAIVQRMYSATDSFPMMAIPTRLTGAVSPYFSRYFGLSTCPALRCFSVVSTAFRWRNAKIIPRADYTTVR